MLYPKNDKEKLDNDLFENPSCEYRGTPFWAWNGKLSDDELLRQIDIMKKMGFGGFHTHVRTGLSSKYLDDEFMDYVKLCLDKAKKDNMLLWLYDEDRWPSGTAGGVVTHNNKEFAEKSLLFTTVPYDEKMICDESPVPGNGQNPVRHNNGTLLCVYDVVLNDDGYIESYRIIDESDEAKGTKWYAYEEYSTLDPWFNNNAYVDTLSEAAIRRFIEVTHEKYKARFGDEFGKKIPAIFTDEPQFLPKNNLNFAKENGDIIFPWTDDLPETFEKTYCESIFNRLPELFWEKADKTYSDFRYKFHNHIADRFVSSYCAQIGKWCEKNNILLSGHIMGEENLETQTLAVGDAMRCYRHFGLIGIDMLCDNHEYTTAKQAQSIARQTGKQGMLSELYGVTGWDYDFRGYKLQGDWQATLGVTVRVPHLMWYTMKGEAKRDYPACIGYQSPWWEKYSIIENHFSRLNTALTRGKAYVKVAVVHPVESYWLLWGDNEHTSFKRKSMENQFLSLAELLLFNLVDFDYICENELPYFANGGSNPLVVGQMQYDVVIVSGLETMRKTTIDILNDFEKQGGKLIFMGKCPEYVDAVKCDGVQHLYERAVHFDYDEGRLLDELEQFRFVDIMKDNGTRSDNIIYNLRQDNDNMWLFLANGKNPISKDVDYNGRIKIILNGEFDVTYYDTMSGKIYPLNCEYDDGKTIIKRNWYMHESMLLRLDKKAENANNIKYSIDSLFDSVPDSSPATMFSKCNIALDEKNMLLLDIAEYSINGGEWQAEEEILRLDNKARKQIGIPLRRKEVVQPYLIEEEAIENFISLRFVFNSEADISDACLALEDSDKAEIIFNSNRIDVVKVGFYVDRCIDVIKLGKIKKGENSIIVTMPIGKRTNLEYMYILGDFSVRIEGTEKIIYDKKDYIGFGDISSQGLPFYTGSINYRLKIYKNDRGSVKIRVPSYRGGLVSAFVDGKFVGDIAFSPYILQTEVLEMGEHIVELKLYGTRQNGFAQLHHQSGVYFYQSPNSWRSAGDFWHYEYEFKKAGILKSPEIYGADIVEYNGKIRCSGSERADHITDKS